MKHLKTYESIYNYKVGDYIILKYSSSIFKIIKIQWKWNNPYFLEYYENNKLSYMNCRPEDIERFASPLEIENMILKNNMNKYNI